MDDHGTALPLDAADREFRDELRDWLDENLVGDFTGQSDRGGPGRRRQLGAAPRLGAQAG